MRSPSLEEPVWISLCAPLFTSALYVHARAFVTQVNEVYTF